MQRSGGIGKRLLALRIIMNAQTTPLAIVVLAAGKGTRMKSDLHKVLHPIAGRPMVEHLMASVAELSPERQVIVAGHGREQLEAAFGGRATIAVQEPQLGTGHAVQQAQAALAGFTGDVLILYGDVPFVRPETMRAMIERCRCGCQENRVSNSSSAGGITVSISPSNA